MMTRVLLKGKKGQTLQKRTMMLSRIRILKLKKSRSQTST
jgi:hypothetical protein